MSNVKPTVHGVTQDTPFARNYAREVLVFDDGSGVWLRDVAGRRYLDMGSGIAVNALGHGDRGLVRAIARQSRRVIHVSNLYATMPSLELGQRLVDACSPVMRTGAAAVQLGNSGSEANEAAIKYARLWSHSVYGGSRHRILSFENAFHGRTMGSLSATPRESYRRKFEPLVPGFAAIPFNDVAALHRAVDDTVCAVLVEVVQGEGGLQVISREMVAALNALGPDCGVLVIADEIQTGLYRLGTFLGSQTYGLEPDIVTLSKPLAGGLPLGATVIPAVVNNCVTPGDHGTTFGGGPVTSAAALYTLRRMESGKFREGVVARAAQLHAGLRELQQQFRWIVELRGEGMLRGLRIDLGPDQSVLYPAIVAAAQENGLLILRSGEDSIRIAPPLVIRERELAEGLARLRKVCEQIDNRRTS